MKTILPPRTTTLKLVDGSAIWDEKDEMKEIRDEVYRKRDFYMALLRKNLENIEAE